MDPPPSLQPHSARQSLSRMFARVSFLPSLAWNVMMERVTGRSWWNRIDAHVVLGALPFRGETTRKLVEEENVKGVVSMNESYELKYLSNGADEWSLLGIKFLQLPTVDIFESPSQQKLLQGVEFIDSIVPTGGSVYVHCKAGRTRSATLVVCYLMSRNGWTPEEAVSHIKQRRPHVLLHKAQWKAIEDFYQAEVKGRRKRKEEEREEGSSR